MYFLLAIVFANLLLATTCEAKSVNGGFLSTAEIPKAIAQGGREDHSNWYRIYSAARENLERRRYDVAEKLFLSSMKEAKNAHGNSSQLAQTRIGLGFVACGRADYKEAEELFSQALNPARHMNDERVLAECLYGLALATMHRNEATKSRPLAEEALALKSRIFGKDSHDAGQCLCVLAGADVRAGTIGTAEKQLEDGLADLKANPGYKGLDYADALRDAALIYQLAGDLKRGRPLFEQSYEIKDDAVDLAHPPALSGSLLYQWENGSPRSLEFPDYDVPLRYITTKDARISACVVDLWELTGVLIAITNISDHEITVGVSSASLFETKPHHQKIELVDPQRIDYIRRERQIWDITYKRPWLANIQKTRTVRGFVPAQGHDLFRGPNIFGIYGDWGGQSRELPEKLTLELSPEHLQEQKETTLDPSLIHSAEANYQELTTFTLSPFESRTGELFFMNPRSLEVLLKVPIGNSIFEFPFKCRIRRIALNDETSPILTSLLGHLANQPAALSPPPESPAPQTF